METNEKEVIVNTLFGPVSLTHFTKNDVNIYHVAHSLSNLCRYNGCCVDYYSVAEHTVLLSRYFRKTAISWKQLHISLGLLLHDTDEAYIGDLISPVKLYNPWVKNSGDNLSVIVFDAFGLNYADLHPIIKEYDLKIRNDEMERLIYPFKQREDKLGVDIHCWNPKQAKHEFLNEFNFLNKCIKDKKLYRE